MLPKTTTIETFSVWVEDHSDELLRWAFFKTRDQQVAEDILQETFLSAFKSFEKFKGNSQPKTWLFSILNNKIIDFHRKRVRSIETNQSAFENEKEADQLFGGLFDSNDRWYKNMRPQEWADDPEQLLDDPNFQKVLASCLFDLPDTWRSVVELKYLGEKKGEEICKELEITTSNYWQLVHRAKMKLRNCIDLNWFKKENE